MSTWVGAGPVGLPLVGGGRRPAARPPVGPAVGCRRRGRRRHGVGVGRRSGARLLLTRRGRLVVGALALAVLASSAVLGRLSLSGEAGTPVVEMPVAPELDPAAGAHAAARAGVAGRVSSAHRSSGSRLAERAVAGRAPVPAGWSVVTATTGDSLWSLARRSVPTADTRDVVERIVERNGLLGTDIDAGDALLVPAP